MHSCIFLSTVDAYLDGLHISLEIDSVDLLGVFIKAAYPLIVFTLALRHGFHLTIGFVYFNKVIFQHIVLLAKT